MGVRDGGAGVKRRGRSDVQDWRRRSGSPAPVRACSRTGLASGAKYFAAIRAGMDRNYEPMAQMFSAVIRRTLQIHGLR